MMYLKRTMDKYLSLEDPKRRRDDIYGSWTVYHCGGNNIFSELT
jgi:hypothetical protein